MRIRDRWRQGAWQTAALLAWLALATPSEAIFLDDEQNVSLRARVYSQLTFRTEDSRSTESLVTKTVPATKAGQVIQHRNSYNPELEAKLVSYTTWMRDVPALSWLAPESLEFRLAAWGFYDGIYDYGSSQFDAARRAPQRVAKGDLKPIVYRDTGGVLRLGTGPCTNNKGCSVTGIFRRGTSLADATDPANDIDARETFAHNNRINELYLSYTKGPLFVRLGRQGISWGESDTIALLDVNNPFDISLAVPGIFQDLDEARIPLWTLRSTLQLFNTLGPLSSGFIEGYWVPGDIDTSVAESPLPLGVSPYSPAGEDPHVQLLYNLVGQGFPPQTANMIADTADVITFDRVPKKGMKRSRGGVRLQTIVGREHTLSGWWYSSFGNQPVARLALPGPSPYAIAMTDRSLVHVFGIGDTFFFEPLDTIVRIEAEYFLGEPGFLNWRDDLPQCVKEMANIPIPKVITDPASNINRPIPRANRLRWEVGLDRFIFIRPLNPTHSFVWNNAFVGDWNLDETKNKDWGFAPGRDTKAFTNAIWQMTMQTDYLHGKLTPRLTTIAGWEGQFAIVMLADYRITDYLLLGAQYHIIDGTFHHAGFNRDRDQALVRFTYQLN